MPWTNLTMKDQNPNCKNQSEDQTRRTEPKRTKTDSTTQTTPDKTDKTLKRKETLRLSSPKHSGLISLVKTGPLQPDSDHLPTPNHASMEGTLWQDNNGLPRPGIDPSNTTLHIPKNDKKESKLVLLQLVPPHLPDPGTRRRTDR